MSKKNCESEARKKIAASIGATPEEIYFTSGRADGHLKALKAVFLPCMNSYFFLLIFMDFRFFQMSTKPCNTLLQPVLKQ